MNVFYLCSLLHAVDTAAIKKDFEAWKSPYKNSADSLVFFVENLTENFKEAKGFHEKGEIAQKINAILNGQVWPIRKTGTSLRHKILNTLVVLNRTMLFPKWQTPLHFDRSPHGKWLEEANLYAKNYVIKKTQNTPWTQENKNVIANWKIARAMVPKKSQKQNITLFSELKFQKGSINELLRSIIMQNCPGITEKDQELFLGNNKNPIAIEQKEIGTEKSSDKIYRVKHEGKLILVMKFMKYENWRFYDQPISRHVIEFFERIPAIQQEFNALKALINCNNSSYQCFINRINDLRAQITQAQIQNDRELLSQLCEEIEIQEFVQRSRHSSPQDGKNIPMSRSGSEFYNRYRALQEILNLIYLQETKNYIDQDIRIAWPESFYRITQKDDQYNTYQEGDYVQEAQRYAQKDNHFTVHHISVLHPGKGETLLSAIKQDPENILKAFGLFYAKFLRKIKIAHGDLHLENIMVNQTKKGYQFTLIDIETAAQMDTNPSIERIIFKDMVKFIPQCISLVDQEPLMHFVDSMIQNTDPKDQNKIINSILYGLFPQAKENPYYDYNDSIQYQKNNLFNFLEDFKNKYNVGKNLQVYEAQDMHQKDQILHYKKLSRHSQELVRHDQAYNAWVQKNNEFNWCMVGKNNTEKGFKLHISATLESALKILKLAMPVLLKQNIQKILQESDPKTLETALSGPLKIQSPYFFKFAPHLTFLSNEYTNLSQMGKFITIYLKSDQEHQQLIHTLDQVFLHAQRIGYLTEQDSIPLFGDMQLGKSGFLYVRYNASDEGLNMYDHLAPLREYVWTKNEDTPALLNDWDVRWKDKSVKLSSKEAWKDICQEWK